MPPTLQAPEPRPSPWITESRMEGALPVLHSLSAQLPGQHPQEPVSQLRRSHSHPMTCYLIQSTRYSSSRCRAVLQRMGTPSLRSISPERLFPRNSSAVNHRYWPWQAIARLFMSEIELLPTCRGWHCPP